FLDPTRPRTTQYGAIVGITALGPHVTQMLLLEPPKNSNLKVYIQFLKPELQSQDSLIRHEALMCYGALMVILNLVICIYTMNLECCQFFLCSIGKIH